MCFTDIITVWLCCCISTQHEPQQPGRHRSACRVFVGGVFEQRDHAENNGEVCVCVCVYVRVREREREREREGEREGGEKCILG